MDQPYIALRIAMKNRIVMYLARKETRTGGCIDLFYSMNFRVESR